MATKRQIPGRDAMARVLDELALRGSRALRRQAVFAAMAQATRQAWKLLPAVPLAVLLLKGLRWLAGAPGFAPGWIPLLLVTLAVPGLWLLKAFLDARRRPIERAAALALFDDLAGAEERLVSADELLGVEHPSGFEAAALEDAAVYLGPARAAHPQLATASPRREGLAAVSASLTIAFILVAVLLGRPTASPEAATGVGGLGIETAARRGGRPDRRPTPPARREAEPVKSGDKPSALDGKEPDSRAAEAAQELADTPRRKEGQSGAGRASQAEASRGEGEARGTPTNQGQTTAQPKKHKRMKPRKKKRSEAAPSPEPEKKKSGEQAGSTSGRGSSRGSNKNPVSSDWTSKDQVTTEEDEEIEDDQDVEDEEVDSEARGGVQPTLRDRKPPVSRDLSIGFGNRPNPNANGRGGASPPKKSRGTASLVLGVPIPDRIKGQANPGKTKVTQERVEPRRERAPRENAQARPARAGPSGSLQRTRFTPWMRDLVRSYFLDLRRQLLDNPKRTNR